MGSFLVLIIENPRWKFGFAMPPWCCSPWQRISFWGVPDHLWVSPTEIHGALGSVNQLSICVGILLVLIAGLPLVHNPAWYGTQPTDPTVKEVSRHTINLPILCWILHFELHTMRMVHPSILFLELTTVYCAQFLLLWGGIVASGTTWTCNC